MRLSHFFARAPGIDVPARARRGLASVVSRLLGAAAEEDLVGIVLSSLCLPPGVVARFEGTRSQARAEVYRLYLHSPHLLFPLLDKHPLLSLSAAETTFVPSVHYHLAVRHIRSPHGVPHPALEPILAALAPEDARRAACVSKEWMRHFG